MLSCGVGHNELDRGMRKGEVGRRDIIEATITFRILIIFYYSKRGFAYEH